MAAWFVYVVRCRDGSLYTGVSTDVAARVATHNSGKGARYTRTRLPVVLLRVERKRNRSAALRRELAIKALSRASKLALVAEAQAPRPPQLVSGVGLCPAIPQGAGRVSMWRKTSSSL